MSAKVVDRLDLLAQSAAEFVQHKAKDHRILVLYPHHKQHTTLMALLHKFYDDQMYFYSLNEEDTDLRSLVWNLSHDAMFPINFGSHSQTAVQTSTVPSDWGRGLAHDLSTLDHTEPIMVLLDDFDFLPRDHEEQTEFLTALANSLPTNIQLIIHGKELHRQPWTDLTKNGLVILLGDDADLGISDFEEAALQGQLEIYALSGGSRVLIDGRPLTAWEGSLPRNLFYYFVDKPMITRAEIFETFWPSMGRREATNVYHVTKRKISEKLGYDLTDYENGFYTPNPQLNRWYDVAIFEEHMNAAMRAQNNRAAEEHWLKAVETYRGQFLKDVEMDWVRQRRQQLRDLYAEALIGLANLYHQQKKDQPALNYFLRAASERPDREDVHRAIMEIYASQKRTDNIKRQYKMLESVLQERLGIQPSPETRNLYNKLVK